MSFPFRPGLHRSTFNLLAFLFHTVLVDPSYQRIRQFLPRKRFFNDLRA